MTRNAPALFVHGGPGMCSIAERERYGDTLPVHWWDQPRAVAQQANPFAALVDATEAELRRLARQHACKLRVLAHSFGSHVALRLAARAPELIDELVLLAPVHDIGAAFVRLSGRLLTANPSNEPLRQAADDFERERTFERFGQLAGQVSAFPNFMDLYWSANADARRRWYAGLLADRPLIDVNAFAAILQSYWEAEPPRDRQAGGVPTRIVFGDADPLVDVEEERRAWSSLLNVTGSVALRSGHFVHLEHEPAVWWPRGWPLGEGA
ncbi:alpha/beta fold hydrolase [Paraburkholderia caballeronis]|uniref:alpha/beta fold hydrolase n=1 Tax=Paraburkholderia caballeronis TaxID=416943 RepID=UPI0010664F42|nr:alpha/beta hydrolase [Paraburkholderia caballeronis]TDV08121.1 pimeloyl-ACP methyl ester carboxylesterase [Paraburkholderia caballeronis]TDV11815.1 pimeloyl-ACP methyl ester carboxylesterase [Paraburkholderia caballeronis]TDV18115.1 pimeloyl-ACP methyl ester carboxylesterase [Paraburkholderia caballeronis]